MVKPKPSLTDLLCTRCGLCCDGSLFADVELTHRAEATGLEILGLDIEEDDNDQGLLLQPCAALQGKRCGIYAQRPECCRTFECRLLQQVKRGEVGVAQARGKITETLRQIARVEKLIGQCGPPNSRLPLKERSAEALAHGADRPRDPKLKSPQAKLQTALAAVEVLVQQSFLGSGTRTRHISAAGKQKPAAFAAGADEKQGLPTIRPSGE